MEAYEKDNKDGSTIPAADRTKGQTHPMGQNVAKNKVFLFGNTKKVLKFQLGFYLP